MGAKLSDGRVEKAHDAGHRTLRWQVSVPAGILSGIDIDELGADANVKKIVPMLPCQPLYFALKQKGLSESLPVLKHISSEQLTRLIDYDCWPKDRIDSEAALIFLEHFGRVSIEHLYERFSGLDEEYQMAILSGLIETYEFDDPLDIPEPLASRLIAMPCRKVYYAIRSDSEDVQRVVKLIVDSAIECNMRYAYALISHASYRPPHEDAAHALRFRNARLEEDGFVSFSESQALFQPVDLKSLSGRWVKEENAKRSGALSREDRLDSPYLDRVLALARSSGWDIDDLYMVHQNLLYLANALGVAMQIEPDDLEGLNRVLLQAQSMVSVGLDYLSQGDTNRALEVLRAEYPKTLFQSGLSLFFESRKKVSEFLSQLQIPSHKEFDRAVRGMQWGRCLLIIDRDFLPIIGFEDAETLKGLFNRIPMLACHGGDDSKTIEFIPISSMVAFDQLRADVSGILGMLTLAKFAGVKEFISSIDLSLNTATLNYLITESFDANRLDRKMLDELSASSLDNARSRFESLKEVLSKHLLDTSSSWAIVQTQHLKWAVKLVLNRLDGTLQSLTTAQHHGSDLDSFVII